MDATPAPMVRFFATTDENSDLGALSIAYLEGILTLGVPIRVLSASGVAALHSEESRWARYRTLFMTTMTAPFVNVVCGAGASWRRFYTLGGGCLRNVLITNADPAAVEGEHLAHARLYQVVVVPTDELAERWRDAGGHPLVVTRAAMDTAAAFRAAIAA